MLEDATKKYKKVSEIQSARFNILQEEISKHSEVITHYLFIYLFICICM